MYADIIINMIDKDTIFLLFISDQRLNLGYQKNIALRMASRYGFFYSVQKLLNDANVNICDHKNIAFIEASEYGHLNVVKLFFEFRIDIGSVAYMDALRRSKKHLHVCKFLKEHRKFHVIYEPKYKKK